MKFYYYALFKKTHEAIEVEFPDLRGCVTFGANWEEAIENAIDALAAEKFVKEPSDHKSLEKLEGELVPIAVDHQIMESYQQLKRFNVIFPIKVLKHIDSFRKKTGLKRSTFLQKAAEEYLQNHETNQ